MRRDYTAALAPVLDPLLTGGERLLVIEVVGPPPGAQAARPEA